ncbi:type II secretion system ATPase GspE [Neochlamydia sp. S13]|uniref:type II secretion system ATPase GspE n=1 Tax=Neochlamydia sp. S13 TaxID=1353976 RepID=UPI0009AE2C3E|nr:type II secretion system ATPase GspE [Neochlamydia sp. S13]BBI16233.1 general secretion pathway protein [Neochlamydia sp. S13]
MTEDKYITSGHLHSKKEAPKQNDDHNRHLALQFGMVIYNDLSSFRISKELIKKTPYTFAKKNFILPLQEDKETVLVVIADPLHLEALEELRLILNKTIKAAYCPKDVILASINDCYNLEHGEASEMLAHLTRGDERVEAEIEIYDLLDNSQHQAPIVKVINLILTEAIQQGASDIHFEPSENGLRVRYRIDGVLQARHSPAPDQQAQLLTRIKVMSRLDIAEHRLPQDGRLKLKMGRREIDFRVSTVPVSGGERIVMRILDKGNVILGLDKIGMPPNCYKDFKKLIAVPEGIILVTGPTGSGKTTTLYSAICEMYNDETNIMTIEDPVEYNLKGIAQIGVHPKIKLDFATGLRHILRQDPDIIMIGEIRDKETAEIAIQASLTGHLVLSTLHTNDAPSAITRLVDMGIEPYLLSSCIIGVLAQRLVRKICSHCKTFYTPTDQEIQNIGLKRENLSEGHLFHGTGCQACYGSGYKGRHGIYELMLVNHAVKQQIVKSPDAVELRRVALHAGMTSLLSHGSLLTKQGITTVAEVLRTTRGIEEG